MIFTAAHNADGKAALLFELEQRGHFSLLTCQLAWEEARRNIAIKFPECTSRLEGLLPQIQVLNVARRSPCPISLPVKDQPIFMSALQCQASHLLTGDRRHFGRYMNKPAETRGILIQTVADFFEAILDRR